MVRRPSPLAKLYRRLLIFLLVAFGVAAAPSIVSAAEDCYPPQFYQKIFNFVEGVKWGERYTYTIVGGTAGVPQHYLDAIVMAMQNWSTLNSGPNGSQAYFVPEPNNPDADIKIVLRDTFAYGAFTCSEPEGCAGTMDNETTWNGTVTGGTMNLAKDMSAQHVASTVVHEMAHFHGLADIYDLAAAGKTVAFADHTSTEPFPCDVIAARDAAHNKRREFKADPCRGGPCAANRPGLGKCYWGNDPVNGFCWPPWMTIPFKGDPEYRIWPNIPPLGGISTASVVAPSGALEVGVLDPDGKVFRVDWYVDGQFSYTALDDPFEMPYTDVAPGTYSVQAQIWDNREGAAWTAPVTVTVQDSGSGGGGGSSDRLNPDEYLLADESRTSSNGEYMLIYQGDGNFVLYRTSDWYALWSTTTWGSPGEAVMQADGNLVVYDASWQAQWSSGTAGHPGAWLAVQADGNLVIYDAYGYPIWTRQ